jgi:flavodoxin
VSGILVVDYSRSGNTHDVAKAISRGCCADLERIHDERSRAGLWGYLRSAREALKQKPGHIRRPKHDPADYDLVVLGSPVWAATCHRRCDVIFWITRASSVALRCSLR